MQAFCEVVAPTSCGGCRTIKKARKMLFFNIFIIKVSTTPTFFSILEQKHPKREIFKCFSVQGSQPGLARPG